MSATMGEPSEAELRAYANRLAERFREDGIDPDRLLIAGTLMRLPEVVSGPALEALERIAPTAPRGDEAPDWTTWEKCGECGRRYGDVYWADDDQWAKVGDTFAGLLCPSCFQEKARALGLEPKMEILAPPLQARARLAPSGDEVAALVERALVENDSNPNCPGCGGPLHSGVPGGWHSRCLGAFRRGVGHALRSRLTREGEPVDVRLDENHEVDEIVGTGFFHMERLGDDVWWFSLQPEGCERVAWTLCGSTCTITEFDGTDLATEIIEQLSRPTTQEADDGE